MYDFMVWITWNIKLKAWNEIPMNIRELPTLYQYKKQLKSHLTSWKNNANTTP